MVESPRFSCMPERPASPDVERRQFLSAVAAGVGIGPIARESVFDVTVAESKYVIAQGGRCVPLAALSGDEPAAAFYDYRTPYSDPAAPTYSSYGTRDLQRPETSQLFLYDGPEGLNLVVIHDALNDRTSGGAVTFEFENLAGGEWVVGDDRYDAPSNYDRFSETASGDGWRVDWTWTTGRSDGGVYGPLGEEFAVTIRPAFNRAAALYGDHYEGEVTDWLALSGDRRDPKRIPLAMDEPLTIRTGTCDGSAPGGSGTKDGSNGTEGRPSSPVSADVRIVPGKVNPRSRGRLPVVVRSTADFDATALDPKTVRFGPGEARPDRWTRTDATGDGRPDLKLLFRLPETGVDWHTDELRLAGETSAGRRVVGTARVELVPRNAGDGNQSEDERGTDGAGDSDRSDSSGREGRNRERRDGDEEGNQKGHSDHERGDDDEGDRDDEEDERDEGTERNDDDDRPRGEREANEDDGEGDEDDEKEDGDDDGRESEWNDNERDDEKQSERGEHDDDEDGGGDDEEGDEEE